MEDSYDWQTKLILVLMYAILALACYQKYRLVSSESQQQSLVLAEQKLRLALSLFDAQQCWNKTDMQTSALRCRFSYPAIVYPSTQLQGILAYAEIDLSLYDIHLRSNGSQLVLSPAGHPRADACYLIFREASLYSSGQIGFNYLSC